MHCWGRQWNFGCFSIFSWKLVPYALLRAPIIFWLCFLYLREIWYIMHCWGRQWYFGCFSISSWKLVQYALLRAPIKFCLCFLYLRENWCSRHCWGRKWYFGCVFYIFVKIGAVCTVEGANEILAVFYICCLIWVKFGTGEVAKTLLGVRFVKSTLWNS